jgi:hypothetical protein
MKTSVIFTATAGLVPLAAAQSTGLITLFLPDSEPRSLEASVVSVDTAGSSPVTHLEVACPTASSPDNDACHAAGIYPARVYHTQGSVWGGTTTYSAAKATITWECTLGGSPPRTGASGDCTSLINSGDTTWSAGSYYDACEVAAHQRPIIVTAGVDKIHSAHYYTIDASQYIALQSSELVEAGCPASQATIWTFPSFPYTKSSSTIAPTTSPTPSTAGETEETSTLPVTGTQTEPAPAATTSPNGAARAGVAPAAALLIGLAAMVGGRGM